MMPNACNGYQCFGTHIEKITLIHSTKTVKYALATRLAKWLSCISSLARATAETQLPEFPQLGFLIRVHKVLQSLLAPDPETHLGRRWFLGDP